jgi:transposase
VEVFEAIRRDRRVSGLSIRALAERHGVHRRTVRQALDNAAPLPRKVPVRRSARLESLKVVIDAMLAADLDAPRKQRHTSRRVAARLADEHGVTGVSYSA